MGPGRKKRKKDEKPAARKTESVVPREGDALWITKDESGYGYSHSVLSVREGEVVLFISEKKKNLTLDSSAGKKRWFKVRRSQSDEVGYVHPSHCRRVRPGSVSSLPADGARGRSDSELPATDIPAAGVTAASLPPDYGASALPGGIDQSVRGDDDTGRYPRGRTRRCKARASHSAQAVGMRECCKNAGIIIFGIFLFTVNPEYFVCILISYISYVAASIRK